MDLEKRKKLSFDKRTDAALLAYDQNTPTTEHVSNGDEEKHPQKLKSFTKG